MLLNIFSSNTKNVENQNIFSSHGYVTFLLYYYLMRAIIGTFFCSHFRKYSKIFLEFLPQFLFLVLLFLYLVVMIFMKWIMYSGELDSWSKCLFVILFFFNLAENACQNLISILPFFKSTIHVITSWERPVLSGIIFLLILLDFSVETEVNKRGSYCAPSVLIYFINMFLMGENEPNKGCDIYMYEYQRLVQIMLFVGALMCIPVMALGKPLLMMYKKKKLVMKFYLLTF